VVTRLAVVAVLLSLGAVVLSEYIARRSRPEDKVGHVL
jgi:hypothetical protein